jgi:hypothetical protein
MLAARDTMPSPDDRTVNPPRADGQAGIRIGEVTDYPDADVSTGTVSVISVP